MDEVDDTSMRLHGIENAGRQSWKVRGHQGTRWVGRDHYDIHLFLCPVIWQKAIWDSMGYL